MKRKFSRLGCGILDVDNLRDALSCIEEELATLKGSKKINIKHNKKLKKSK